MCDRLLFRCAFAALVTRLVLADDHDQGPTCESRPPLQPLELRQHSLLQVQSEKIVEHLEDTDAPGHPLAVSENGTTAPAALELPSGAALTSLASNDTDDFSQLLADVSIVASGFVQDARATPMLAWIRELWSNRRIWMHIGLWISIPTAMLLAALRVRRYEEESASARGRIVPIAAASSMVVFLSLVTQHLGNPWQHFSPTSALITVVFVMDMGTLERFIIKVTLRTVGTVLGGTLAVLAGELSDLCDHHVMIQVCCCFTVFSFDMILARKFNYMTYTFTMQSVTFALVFFGYVARGWEAVWERLFSVAVGIVTAIVCNVFFSATDGGIGDVTAISSIIMKSEQIFNRALVALDFAFMRNAILAAPDDDTLLGVGQLSYQEEVLSWFGFGVEETTEPDLQELRELARSTTFHDLPMDVTVSVLQAECRQCWSDMKFVRAIFPHNFCGRRVFQSPLPSFCSLPERAHPVFLQASALAHSGAIAADVWQKEGKELERVRVEIQGLQPRFESLFEYKLASQKKKRGPSEDDKKLVLTALRELVDGLERAQSELNEIWTPPGTSRSSTAKLFDLVGMGGGRQRGSSATMDRFHGFCQGLSLIIMDFSLFVLCCIKLMHLADDDNSGTIYQIMLKLATVGCIDLSGLEEQMEAPLDIDSSDIVKNWRRRAKRAARAALEPLGLQELIPKKLHRRGSTSGQNSKTMTVKSGEASQPLEGGEAAANADASGSQSLRVARVRSSSPSSESSSFSV